MINFIHRNRRSYDMFIRHRIVRLIQTVMQIYQFYCNTHYFTYCELQQRIITPFSILLLSTDTYTTTVNETSVEMPTEGSEKHLFCLVRDKGKPAVITRYVWTKNGERLNPTGRHNSFEREFHILVRPYCTLVCHVSPQFILETIKPNHPLEYKSNYHGNSTKLSYLSYLVAMGCFRTSVATWILGYINVSLKMPLGLQERMRQCHFSWKRGVSCHKYVCSNSRVFVSPEIGIELKIVKTIYLVVIEFDVLQWKVSFKLLFNVDT